MAIEVDPAISMLVLEVTRLDADDRAARLERERKIIAAKELADSGPTRINAWKRLYLQLRGAPVSELEFVKACASPDRRIKRTGYLGLVFLEAPRHALMMHSTVCRDLQGGRCTEEALAFLANYNDHEQRLAELGAQIRPVPESARGYSRFIIAKSRLGGGAPFSVVSSSEATLLAKLQILLDGDALDGLSENELLYLREQIHVTRCKFTVMKLIQLYTRLHRRGLFSVDERLFAFLKGLLVGPTPKATKQIDIGLSIESCKLLFESNNFHEKAEGFVFRLISSENPNSRHLAFGFVSRYGVLAELAMERIVKLGAHHPSHLGALVSLIDRSNCRRIYKQREEIMHYVLKSTAGFGAAEAVSTRLLVRIAELADFEFLCKILSENPGIYKHIRGRGLLSMDHTGPLFRMIVQKEDTEFFQLIYDIVPPGLRDDALIASLACRHLAALSAGPADRRRLALLDGLCDVLTAHGNIEENRLLLREAHRRCITDGADAVLAEKLLSGILLFNLVLDKKYLHVDGANFAEYRIDGDEACILFGLGIRSIEVFDADWRAFEVSASASEDATLLSFRTGRARSAILKIASETQLVTRTIALN